MVKSRIERTKLSDICLYVKEVYEPNAASLKRMKWLGDVKDLFNERVIKDYWNQDWWVGKRWKKINVDWQNEFLRTILVKGTWYRYKGGNKSWKKSWKKEVGSSSSSSSWRLFNPMGSDWRSDAIFNEEDWSYWGQIPGHVYLVVKINL